MATLAAPMRAAVVSPISMPTLGRRAYAAGTTLVLKPPWPRPSPWPPRSHSGRLFILRRLTAPPLSAGDAPDGARRPTPQPWVARSCRCASRIGIPAASAATGRCEQARCSASCRTSFRGSAKAREADGRVGNPAARIRRPSHTVGCITCTPRRWRGQRPLTRRDSGRGPRRSGYNFGTRRERDLGTFRW